MPNTMAPRGMTDGVNEQGLVSVRHLYPEFNAAQGVEGAPAHDKTGCPYNSSVSTR